MTRWWLPNTLDFYGPRLRVLSRLSPDMLHDDDRDDDFLRHCPPVDKASASAEMEQISSLGYPELGIPFCSSCHANFAVPRRVVVGKIRTEEIALLRDDRGVRLVLQLAPVRLARGVSVNRKLRTTQSWRPVPRSSTR